MLQKLFYKASIIISALLLLSFQFAYAQETNSSPSDTQITSPSPTSEVSPSPSATIESTVSPSPSASVENTPVPSASSEVVVSPTPTPNVSANPPPTDPDASLVAVVLADTSATSVNQLDLDPSNVTSSATLTTDKGDYAPTDTAVIAGTNLNPEESYILYISSTDPPAVNFQTDIKTDEKGGFVYAYQLDGNYRPNYSVELKDQAGNTVATTSFTDTPAPNPSVKISQCQNGGTVGNPLEICAGNNWVTGAVNGQKAHWHEGDLLPYRAIVKDLFAGVNTITLSFDTAKSSELKHAADYIGSYDYTETTGAATATHANQIDPCSDAFSCDPINAKDVSNPLGFVASPAITTPSGLTSSYPTSCANGTFLPGSVIAGAVKAWSSGGAVSALSVAYVDTPPVNAGATDCPAKFKITFTVSAAHEDVILAWGGHVAANAEWGSGNAVPTGSPYHMHAGFAQESPVGTSFTVGNQDLALASSAIVQTGTIIVEKQTNPDGAAGSFTFTGNAAGTISDNGQIVVADLAPGTYTSTETNPGPTFTLNSIVCDDGSSTTPSTISVGTRTATFHLDPGETIKCTFTNNQQIGHIIVVKDSLPNDPQNFTFTNDFGNSNPATFNLDDDSDNTLSNSRDSAVITGKYAVSEGAVSGWDSDGGVCDQGETPGDIDVAPGETVTCTFTNGKRPTLTLQKTVVIDNGGTAVEDDFQASINTTEVDWDLTQTLDPGDYTASEVTLSGYTPSDWGTNCAANGSVTLAYGDEKVCTITNDDDAPTLTLVKVVDNGDGGEAVESDWTLAADGPTGFSGAGPTVNNGDSFDAGTYDLSESGPEGYSASSWVCQGGTQDDNDTVTLGLGESATCTITNDDIAPTLKLVKEVIIDNGGTKEAGDWDLTATGTPGTFTDAGDSETFHTVKAGVGYTLSESSISGYLASSWSCNSQGVLVDDVVTLGLNQNVTCKIENNDIQPKLTVIKHVENDNGGTASAEDFGMLVSATNASPSAFAGDELGTIVNLDAGSYSVDEIGVSGYEMSSSADCSGSIDIGETKTCTITNTAQPGTLHVIKVLPNDNGGTKHAQDFSFSVNNGDAQAFESDGQNDLTVDAGTYSVVETNPANGYTLSYDNCTDLVIPNGGEETCTITNDDQPAHLTVNKVLQGPIFLSHDPGHFDILVDDDPKAVGIGDSSPGAFNGDIDGTTGSFEINAGSHTIIEQGTEASNTDLSNYEHSISCVDGNNDTVTVTSNRGDFPWGINLANGDNVICTINNTPAGTAQGIGQLVIVKNNIGVGDTIFNYSGTQTIPGSDISPYKDITPFTASVETHSGTGSTDDTFSSPTVISFPDFPATVTLGEDGPPEGWAFTSVNCESFAPFSENPGQSTVTDTNGSQVTINFVSDEKVVCTYTNTKLPKLIVVKHVNNNDLGVSSASDFTMTINGTAVGVGVSFAGAENPGVITQVNAGSYSVTESGPGGYNATYSSDCTGTIGPGETKTCTITNDDLQGRMTGGGSVFTRSGSPDLDTVNGTSTNNVRVTHGFQIHCRLPDRNDNIEINWNDKTGKSHNFHLETLTGAVCTKTGNPAPPKNTANGFNVFTGTGVGRYDGVAGATLNFVFVDNGEPGKLDTAQYLVKTNGGSTTVLDVDPKKLDQGNHQAHRF